MNIIKIRALNTEDYITAVLHGRCVCMLMHVCMLECVKGYRSLLERLRQKKRGKKAMGSPLIQSRPDMAMSLPLHFSEINFFFLRRRAAADTCK